MLTERQLQQVQLLRKQASAYSAIKAGIGWLGNKLHPALRNIEKPVAKLKPGAGFWAGSGLLGGAAGMHYLPDYLKQWLGNKDNTERLVRGAAGAGVGSLLGGGLNYMRGGQFSHGAIAGLGLGAGLGYISPELEQLANEHTPPPPQY